MTLQTLKSYLELTRPRLTLMALLTAISSLYLASPAGVNWTLLSHTLWGTTWVGGGANALNQYLERGVDARMRRTAQRPLVRGTVGETPALLFGLAASLLGVCWLGVFVNILTMLLGLSILALYVLVYTPLKAKTPLNTLVGAVPGALPALLGWAAARGRLDPGGWSLFFILFFWQIPHFMAIAWIYREDYLQGGLRMLSVTDPDGKRTGSWILFCGALLFAASFGPVLFGVTGSLYLSAAAFSGLLFLAFASYVATHALVHAKALVTASIFYLAVLNCFFFLDKA